MTKELKPTCIACGAELDAEDIRLKRQYCVECRESEEGELPND